MSDAPAINARAAQALREGRVADAAELFEQLTRLDADNANAWFNLGWSLRAGRQYEAALNAYAEALKRGVAHPEDVHVNRSVILSEYLHRTDEAAAELRKAVELSPASVSAWINLGSLHEDFGEADAARDAYRQALQADPASGRAIARIAALDVHGGRPAQAIAMLLSAARGPARSAQDAAEIQFALGNALDAEGDFQGAFAAITEANRFGSGARPAGLRYDPIGQERLVDALIAMPPLQGAEPAAGLQSPIFICGMFRSGSTLAEQLLGRHRQVTAGGELEFIPAMVKEQLQPYPASLVAAPTAKFAELRDDYMRQLDRLYPGAGRITDKRPDNFLHIALIKALFADAKIVHTVRDPLDNILSVYFLYFADSVTYSGSLDEIVHYYSQYRRLMDHWRDLFARYIHDLSYDRLVADPVTEMDRLGTFCGLDADASVFGQGLDRGPVRTASSWQVRKPLHRRSSGRWRNYAKQLEPVRQRLADAGWSADPD